MPDEAITDFAAGSPAKGGVIPIVQDAATKKVTVGTAAYKEAGSDSGDVPVLNSAGAVATTDGGTGVSLDATGNSSTSQYYGTDSSGAAGMHNLPEGVELYSASAIYRLNAVVVGGTASYSRLYRSLGNNNNGNALTNTTWWAPLGPEDGDITIDSIDTSDSPANNEVLAATGGTTAQWKQVDSSLIAAGGVAGSNLQSGAVDAGKMNASVRANEEDVLTGTSNDKFVTCLSLNEKIEEFEKMNDEFFSDWSSVVEEGITSFSATFPTDLTDLTGTIALQDSASYSMQTGSIATGGLLYASSTCIQRPSLPNNVNLSAFKGALLFVDGDNRRWAFLNIHPQPQDSLAYYLNGSVWERVGVGSDVMRTSFASLPDDNKWYPISYKAHDGPAVNAFNDEIALGRRNGGVFTALRIGFDSSANPDEHQFLASQKHLEISLDRLELPDGATAGQAIVVNADADSYTVSAVSGGGLSIGGTQANHDIIKSTGTSAQSWGKLTNDNVASDAAIAQSKLAAIATTDLPSIPYSKLSLSDDDIPQAKVNLSIANADVASDAGIAQSKLAAIATGDLPSSIPQSKLDLSISNSDVASDAEIAQSKLADLTASDLPSGTVVAGGSNPTGGQVLTYNSSNQQYEPATPSNSGTLSYSTETLWSVAYANRVLNAGSTVYNLDTGKSFADWDFVHFKMQNGNYTYYTQLYDTGSVGANNELIDANGRNIDLVTNTTWKLTATNVGGASGGLVGIIGSKYTLS